MFVIDLRRHLLGRLLGRQFDGEEDKYSHRELAEVQIINNRIYEHNTLRIHYTTYDMRQGQDSINPCTHPDIMMLSSEDEGLPDGAAPHPYLYARVIGIYHAEVRHESPHAPTSTPQVMQFFLRAVG